MAGICSPATRISAAPCGRWLRSTPRCRATRPGRPVCAGRSRPTRANTPVVSFDARRGRIKIAPLARWTDDRVDRLHQPTRCAGQPAAVRRVSVDRLRTVHPPGAPWRGRQGRPLGRADQDRMRDPHMSSTLASRPAAQTPHPHQGCHGLADRAAERRQDHPGAARWPMTARRRGRTPRSWTATRCGPSCLPGWASPRPTGTLRAPGSVIVAELLARHGVVVLVPVIAPYERSPGRRCALAPPTNGTDYLLVHVSTPVRGLRGAGCERPVRQSVPRRDQRDDRCRRPLRSAGRTGSADGHRRRGPGRAPCRSCCRTAVRTGGDSR